jgi:hypothetical protein
MSEELFAVSTISPAAAAQSDYDSICAALMQTERGRWFLEEYAKRNRSADTQILLAAIQRIETVVCADRSEREKQAQQGFRTDLLEMAEAITRTRAEVAEIPSDSALRPEAAGLDGEAEPPPRSRNVFAAAERIRDVTWAMRGHGFDPSTCDQLEELAASILSASALRDPTDRRASKLSEVLQYLEHRIETLLVGSADGEAAEAAPEPRSHAALPAPTAEAEFVIGFPGPALSTAHDDLEGDTEVPPRPAVEIAPQEPPPARELEAAAVADETKPETKAVEGQAEESISPRIQEVEAQAAELKSAFEPGMADGAEPASLSADQAPADALTAAPDRSLDRVIEARVPAADGALVPDPESDLPATDAEPEPAPPEAEIQEAQAQTAEPAPLSTPAMDPDALAAGQEVRLPAVDLTYAIAWLPGSSGLREIAAAPLTIEADLDDASWAALDPPEPGRLPPAPQPDAAEDMLAWQIEVPKSVEAAELPGAPARGAPAQAAAAAMPQLLHGDPLAALEVMSPEELIALFS